jgi:hypothetical protein
MIVDDLLLALIVAGIGLTGAYVRSEVLSHMRTVAFQRSRHRLRREFRISPPKPSAPATKSGP